MKKNLIDNNFFIKKLVYLIKKDTLITIINFILSLILFIILIALIVSSSNANEAVIKMLIYAGFLPLVILNTIFSIFIISSVIFHNKNDWYKIWWFYLPIALIVCEIIVLPIPISFINRLDANSGVLWSILIFSFVILLASGINLVNIYKENFSKITYVVENNIDNNDQSSSNNDSNNDLNSSSNNKTENNTNDEVIKPDYIITDDGKIK